MPAVLRWLFGEIMGTRAKTEKAEESVKLVRIVVQFQGGSRWLAMETFKTTKEATFWLNANKPPAGVIGVEFLE